MNQKRFENIKEVLHDCSASFFNDKFLNIISIEELIIIIKESKNSRISFRAAWALEHILLQNVDLIGQYFSDIIYLYDVNNNESILRCLSKIIMSLAKANIEIEEIYLEMILNKTFYLIENQDTPIAVRCNAYDILYNMSLKQKWIASELTIHLKLHLEKYDSPALKSRGKRILNKLERIS